jgi:hypothetical protein
MEYEKRYCKKYNNIEDIHQTLELLDGLVWVLNIIHSREIDITRSQLWEIFYTRRGKIRSSGYSSKIMLRYLGSLGFLKNIINSYCE